MNYHDNSSKWWSHSTSLIRICDLFWGNFFMKKNQLSLLISLKISLNNIWFQFMPEFSIQIAFIQIKINILI